MNKQTEKSSTYKENRTLDYLYDQVLNRLDDFDDVENTLNHENYTFTAGQMQQFRDEYAWIKSEHMCYSKLLAQKEDEVFLLQRSHQELMKLVQRQSVEIRKLKGYRRPKRRNNVRKSRMSTLSLWMVFPVLGMLSGGLIEFFRVYDPVYIYELCINYLSILN